ncbi:MAG TPA: TonB-dependent receptor [Opitutus sp.]|nr:TonB-dependent receptor [Opitutus sp.]
MHFEHLPSRFLVRLCPFLVLGLALVCTAASRAAHPDPEVQALREENAALKKRVAELEAQLAAVAGKTAKSAESTAAAAAAPPPAAAAAPEPAAAMPGLQVLSPFEVRTDHDIGYLKTNSVTATRVGTPIQEIPLSVSVFGADFIADTGMREIQDVLRYTASAAGDTRLGIKPPGNSATPSGTFTLRGFPVSARLRDGLDRFSYYNMDTVDRIEVVKGPAAVFYGQGFPGGVINYVTKKPEFTPLPTTLSYSYGGNTQRTGTERVALDHNTVLSPHTVLRFVGAWDNDVGSQRGEFKKAVTVAPSVAFIPFDSGKLRLEAGLEYVKASQNSDGQGWIYPEQWFADYKNPPAALIAAAGVADADAYRARIFNNVNAWIADVRRVNQGNDLAANFDANNNYVPPVALWTSLERGAEYDQLGGTRVYDSAFNNRGIGSVADNTDSTFTVSAEADPTDWLSARYSFTKNTSSYSQLTSQATPYADGYRFNFSGLSARTDERNSATHQYDFVLRKELFGVKHKLMLGGLYDRSVYSYYAASGFLFTNIPGVALPSSGIPATIVSTSADPLFPPLTSVIVYNGTAPGGQTALQQLYGRDGRALNPGEVFQQFDPALQPVPDIRRVTPIDRGLVDRYAPRREEYYFSYMASLLDDRINLFAGYRTTNEYDGDQRVSANPPWYNGFEDMGAALSPTGQIANGISTAAGSYYLGTYLPKQGDSSMAGVSFALTKGLTLYASYSRTYLPNTGYLALLDEDQVRAKATSLGLDPDAEIARLHAAGSDTPLKNELGQNYELGAKLSLWDHRLAGTFSVFRLLRSNEKLDDTQRQIEEPLNYSAPDRGGTYSTASATGGVRWYSNSSTREVEGAEAEITWTPVPNYQLFANASWLPVAKTIADPRIFDPAHPPAGATVAQIQANSMAYYFTYDFRMPNVPEYRFNLFNKYTFASGGLRGLSLMLGARYASVMNIANDINTDSQHGGVTAGDYLVFDGGLSYPWLFHHRLLETSLQITNLTDVEYNEGSGGLSGGGFLTSPPRTWLLTNTLKF